MSPAGRRLCVLALILIAIFILAFIIGYFARSAKEVVTEIEKPQKVHQPNQDVHKDIVAQLSAENMEKNLRYFAAEAHVAGSDRNNKLGDEMYNRFKSYGFEAKKESYNVLLSFPQKTKPNKVSLLDSKGTLQQSLQIMEDKLAPDEDLSKTLQPFNAYGKEGVVEGDLVYVNYGHDSDFKLLQEKFNINFTGKIVLARYGKGSRKIKPLNAEKYGAAATLMYHDPKDYAPRGAGPRFPTGWWLSDDGVQRGNIKLAAGDPVTPFYPSTDDAFRIKDTDDEAALPKIPCQPISMRNARKLFEHIAGSDAPNDWQGELQLKYKVGPGLKNGWKLKVEVYNTREQVKITNVFGVLRGAVEPDRYVLVGNHRDAWVNGAADPSSGTSVMMEIARAFGTKVKAGWKPHRTLIFCSWDGEEHGLIGSVEWVEQHAKLLQNKAVAYVNLDTVVFGNSSLRGNGSPLINNAFFEALMQTEDAHNPSITAFERTKTTYPSKTRPGFPRVGSLGAGSDYFAFYHRLGIPSLDLTYTMATLNQKFNTSFYPVYHTLHDTFTWMKKFTDPGFRCHLTVGRVAASVLLRLADTPVIPWNVSDMAFDMQTALQKLDDRFSKTNASVYKAETKYLKIAINKFTDAAKTFHSSLEAKTLTKFSTVRMVNDVLMQLEKGFVYPGGLPSRPLYSHMISSPPSGFPSIIDALEDAKKDKSLWKEVKKQVSIVASTIESVAEALNGGFET